MSLYDDIDIAESVAKDKKAELGEWAKGWWHNVDSLKLDEGWITSTPNAVLPLFTTSFAACTGGIWVTFIEPYLI